MSTDETIEQGDYVKYTAPFHDGIAMGREIGCGYVVELKDDLCMVRNGDRHVVVKIDHCEMRAKQYRLPL